MIDIDSLRSLSLDFISQGYDRFDAIDMACEQLNYDYDSIDLLFDYFFGDVL
jgi:hypothetical protein